MTYRGGVLVMSLALAGCSDDVATTVDGSSSGSTGQDTTTGTPTTVDPTDPTTTVTPTTTVDPDTTVTITDPTSDTDPTVTATVTDTDATVSATDTDVTVTATDTGTGSTGSTGSTGDTTDTTGTTGEPFVCGDGQVDPGEGCDDGADNGDDKACKLDCTPNVCGDGALGPEETCDDGAGNGDDKACKLDCTPNVCGDGALGPGEACDDGANNGDSNACKSDCTPNFCGDGFTQAVAGEGCDDGAQNGDQADCTSTCNPAACGDGQIHNLGTGSEQCDNGNNNGPGQLCNAACELNVCGDGDQGPGEGCDDNNLGNGDGCDQNCALEVCGDNKTDANEACDDGKNGDQDDGCTDQCLLPACGDGFDQPNAGEACDLGGNNSDTGDCTIACKDAACGDSLIHAGVEQCDDGPNNANSKACKADCSENVCPDGFVEVGVEECDDGNMNDVDGCSNVCKAALCNDGLKNNGETEVDCGGANCSICPTVIMFAGGTGAPGNLGGSYTIGTGWTPLTPLASETTVGVDVTMTSNNLGVGLVRYIKANNPLQNTVYSVTWDKGVWTQPQTLPGGLKIASTPRIDSADDTAQAVFNSVDAKKMLYAKFANGVWSPIEDTGGTLEVIAGDIAALGSNAAAFFYDNAANNRLSSRDRVAGVWGVINPYANIVNVAISPTVVRMNGGAAELMGLWAFDVTGAMRFGQRTNGVWGGAATVPNLSTGERVSAAAGPGGTVAVVFRGKADGKFHSVAYASGFWFGPFDMPGEPLISSPPAIAAGVGGHVAETVYVSDGKIYHSSLIGQAWSVPVLVGGTTARTVSLARSN